MVLRLKIGSEISYGNCDLPDGKDLVPDASRSPLSDVYRDEPIKLGKLFRSCFKDRSDPKEFRMVKQDPSKSVQAIS
jgi:hypothetical protein